MDDKDCYTIPAFCQRNNISQSFYHKLQVDGLGPRVMKVGGRTLISVEAAAYWRREREEAATKAREAA